MRRNTPWAAALSLAGQTHGDREQEEANKKKANGE